MNRSPTELPAMSTGQASLLPWYVCRTKPRQEYLATRKLREQDYEVFIPIFTEWMKRNGAWQRQHSVMFPRYCFVRCGRSGQSLGPIRSTPGVTGLVSFSNSPATLKAGQIEAIRALSDDQQRVAKEVPIFRAGDAVEISSGPLKGLNGIVSKAAEERVAVLLSLLGREKAVVLLADQLTLA